MAVADVASASSEPTVSVSTRRQPRRLPWLTTPGWFRLAAVVLLAGLVALAVVSVGAALGRGDATDAVGTTPPRCSWAPRTCTSRWPTPMPQLRPRSSAPGSNPRSYGPATWTTWRPQARSWRSSRRGRVTRRRRAKPWRRITQELPVYAGQVESARTNNRLDHPLGAAYLRRASDSMRNSMLPAATSIYEEAARRLYDAYDEGTSTRHRVTVLAVGGTVLVLLVAAQVLVALRTRRVLNLGLVGATVIVAALGAWALLALDAQEQALSRSQREGSDQLIVLSTARILALRSLSDENLHLIERGTDPAHREDFELVTAHVGGTDGLLDDATELAERTGSTAAIERIRGLWDDYLAVNDRVRQLDDAGTYLPAVAVAVTDEAGAAARLDAALDAEIDAARDRLDAGAAAAGGHVRWLTVSVLAAIALAAVLVVVGIWVRMKEYR